MLRTFGLRARRRRDRLRRAHRAREWPSATHRCLDARSGRRREHGDAVALPETGFRGTRRGANIGQTREIWPTLDGFVSFGLRGGKGAVPSLETLTRLVATDTLRAVDWSTFSPNTADDETLRAIEPTSRRTSPATPCRSCTTSRARPTSCSPRSTPRPRFSRAHSWRRVSSSPRSPTGGERPDRFSPVRAPPEHRWLRRQGPEPRSPVEPGPGPISSSWGGPPAPSPRATSRNTARRCCASSRRAAPTSSASTRSARTTRTASKARRCSTASTPAKRDVLFNLKHPKAVELVRRLVVEWADAVAENFAPRAMKGFGLDYDSLVALKPDLVMVSACLNGQTGPHKDYPGFGGQGSALAGIQLPHRVARPRARRTARHDHRLPRAAFRRDCARRRLVASPAHGPGHLSRRQPGGSRDLHPHAVAAGVPGDGRRARPRRQRRARRDARRVSCATRPTVRGAA